MKETWMKQVTSYPRLAGADYCVAYWILVHLNFHDEIAWPAIDTLAKVTNRSRSTVSRSIKRLEKLEFLTIKHSRGRTHSNEYSLGSPYYALPIQKRPSVARGKVLRTRNENAASRNRKCSEFAARISEEEHKNRIDGIRRRNSNSDHLITNDGG